MTSNILDIKTITPTEAIHILNREIDTELLSTADKRKIDKVIGLLWKYEEIENNTIKG